MVINFILRKDESIYAFTPIKVAAALADSVFAYQDQDEYTYEELDRRSRFIKEVAEHLEMVAESRVIPKEADKENPGIIFEED